MADENFLREQKMQQTIVDMYKKGYSIDFITNKYFKYKNMEMKYVRKGYDLLITGKNINKVQARNYVLSTIYHHLINTYKHAPRSDMRGVRLASIRKCYTFSLRVVAGGG